MKRIKTTLLSIFFICINMLQVFAQNQEITQEEIRIQLAKFNDVYNQGMKKADFGLVQKYYAEDIKLMPAFQKTLLSKAHAKLYHQAFFKRFDVITYTRKNVETLDLGIQLCVIGEFSMIVRPKNQEKNEELKGKYMSIWKKDQDALSLLSEIWNYNHHTDLTEQLKFEAVPGITLGYQSHLPLDTDIRFEIACINHFSEEFIAQGDHRLWSRLYADDAIALFSYKPIYKGKKSLDAFIKNHVEELPIFEKLDIRNNYIDDLGKYVVNYASHIANWRNNEYSGISTGKGIKIWRRTPNGTLKIIRQISTYDYNY